jgi:hypothetical protein
MTNTSNNTENASDGASKNTEDTNHKKYKKFIFRTIFFCFQRWSNVVIEKHERMSDVFQKDKYSSLLYSSMNIRVVEDFNEDEYGKVCMKNVYDLVQAHKLSLSTMNDDNKQQDARSLNSISTATSPESLSFLENKRNAGQRIDHPPDIASIQCKRNQEIKDEFYKHVNGFYDNYVGTKQMWNAVLIGGIIPTGKKNGNDRTHDCFFPRHIHFF